MERVLQYVLFFVTFILSDFVSIWGQYFTLKYPNMTMWESFIQAVPWAWLTWIFTSIAVYISDKHDLVTPMQVTFLMMIDQFVATLLVNKYWLHQVITRSDYLTFLVILVGFLCQLRAASVKVPRYSNSDSTKEAHRR